MYISNNPHTYFIFHLVTHTEVGCMFLKNPGDGVIWVSVLVLGAADHPVPVLPGPQYPYICGWLPVWLSLPVVLMQELLLVNMKLQGMD